MKKITVSIILISLSVLLTACGSNAYKENIKKGEKALEERNYEAAIAYFANATKENPKSNEAFVMTATANGAYFDALYQQGTTALEKQAFKEAKELFEKAYEIDPVKEEDILDKKLQAENLEMKQKQLNHYSQWLKKIAPMNITLSQEWRSASTNLSTGTIGIPEFKEKAQQSLATLQKVLESAEAEISNIGGDLSTIHNNYLNKLQEDFGKLRLVILRTNEENPNIETILTEGQAMNDILQKQALLVQELKGYAQNQGIKFSEN